MTSFLRRQAESRWNQESPPLLDALTHCSHELGHRKVDLISLRNLILRSSLVFPTIYSQAAELDFEPRDSHAQRDGASCGYTKTKKVHEEEEGTKRKNTALCPRNALLSDEALTVGSLKSEV
jgi:hypothetical protein